MIPRLKRE